VKAATQNAIELVRRALPHVAALGEKSCPCQSALALALWTEKNKIRERAERKLAPIRGKYTG